MKKWYKKYYEKLLLLGKLFEFLVYIFKTTQQILFKKIGKILIVLKYFKEMYEFVLHILPIKILIKLLIYKL